MREIRVGMLAPDLYYSSVTEIDLAMLTEAGVRHLLMDLDNTLMPRDRSDVPDEVREWLDALPGLGMDACLVSNNWHAHVQGVADLIGLPIVAKALKPFPSAFRKGLAALGATPRDAAVIGDQIFTDVLGGNLLGMTTVLVKPQSKSDLPHTLLLRRAERLVLAGREPLA
ncbi:MAG: YqeG family HAD IIIA-type phosphatase [Anaerosomatales bacterium]|nr:YqeG family HAD IIIA-type phosphatase [Anaerosomatales bacterium]MDT8433189.1 YqeG family HAD IIIA-type phosphatase [Anaerosomatales bacterium]